MRTEFLRPIITAFSQNLSNIVVIASTDAHASAPQSDVKGNVVIASEAKQSQTWRLLRRKIAPRNDEKLLMEGE